MDRVSYGRVIKKHAVKMAQGRRLLAPAPQPPRGGSGSEARIVQQTDRGVQIEVTCACGQKTLLQCDYAAGASGPEGPPQGT